MVVAVNEKAAFVTWLRYVTFGTLLSRDPDGEGGIDASLLFR